ncbi:MAG: hypothetical protein ACKVHE_26625 [Planctomycetales bacterium]
MNSLTQQSLQTLPPSKYSTKYPQSDGHSRVTMLKTMARDNKREGSERRLKMMAVDRAIRASGPARIPRRVIADPEGPGSIQCITQDEVGPDS